MGKMPFAGLIGACSLGMMLTGCNCCDKQGTRSSSFAGGKADVGMGLIHPKDPNRSKPSLASQAGDYVNPQAFISPPAYSGSGAAANSLASGSGGSSSPGGFGAAAPPPGNYGNMPMTSGNSSLQSYNAPTTPGGAIMSSPGGMSNSIGMSNSSSLTMSGANSARLPSSPIQQVSAQMGGSSMVKNAAFSSAGSNTMPALPMKGPDSLTIPPPPNTLNAYAPSPGSKTSIGTAISSKTSSTTAASTTSTNINPYPGSSSPPPPPLPSIGSSLPNAPPSSLTVGSTSSMSSSGTTIPTNSGSSPMVPSYLSTNR